MMSDAGSTLIELGAIGAPFGVRGWVKLRSDTEPPDRILKYPVWSLALKNENRDYAIEHSGRSSGQLTVKFAGVENRDAAAALTGAAVLVLRAQLPAPGEKEFYRADLIGFDVENLSGQKLGTLQYFVETPAHALMVINGPVQLLVPAIADHIRRVDLPAHKMIVDWDDTATG